MIPLIILSIYLLVSVSMAVSIYNHARRKAKLKVDEEMARPWDSSEEDLCKAYKETFYSELINDETVVTLILWPCYLLLAIVIAPFAGAYFAIRFISKNVIEKLLIKSDLQKIKNDLVVKDVIK